MPFSLSRTTHGCMTAGTSVSNRQMRSNSQETVGTSTTRRTFSPGSGCGAKTIWLSPTSDT
eukprot:1335466-Rhodomonas_salina.1